MSLLHSILFLQYWMKRKQIFLNQLAARRVLLIHRHFALRRFNYVIGACVTLHNICEMFKEAFCEEWLEEVARAAREYPQPRNNTVSEQRDNLLNARKIQDALMTYVNRNQV